MDPPRARQRLGRRGGLMPVAAPVLFVVAAGVAGDARQP
ncbi:uncharacterized protein AruCF_5367 [Achromobacter ruhlandii]|nr:uncharacterized protein AruCF_5367 [Achromobacter ruhlandii]